MAASTVTVQLNERSYPILVTHRDRDGFAPFVERCVRTRGALIVTDPHVAPHAEAIAQSLKFRVEMMTIPAGEEHKSLTTAAQLYDRLAEMPADRQTLVIPVGGGVVGDVAGFAAATYARGLPMLMAPTTLLAMVDSSVGGKVGVNHPKAKNLIGAFHQPVGVWIDTAFLATLPEREFRSGMAEVIKYGVILDAEFFCYLEKSAQAILQRRPENLGHVIARCCRLKADIVEKDEREVTGLRAVLNYGHTFAHAFEAVAGYGTWLHGEAVAAGMMCAIRLAEKKGLIGKDLSQRQRGLLEIFGLPIRPASWPVGDLIAAMAKDKKAAAGKLRFILPRQLGEAALFDDVSEGEVRLILEELMNQENS